MTLSIQESTIDERPSLRLSFRADVAVVEEPDRLVLRSPGGDLVVKSPAPGLRSAMLAIASGKETEDSLGAAVVSADGAGGLPSFYGHLAKFDVFGMLCRSVIAGGQPIATIVPFSPSYRFRFETIDPAKAYVLSRFAYWRREGDRLVVESPRAHARLEIHEARPRRCWRGSPAGRAAHRSRRRRTRPRSGGRRRPSSRRWRARRNRRAARVVGVSRPAFPLAQPLRAARQRQRRDLQPRRGVRSSSGGEAGARRRDGPAATARHRAAGRRRPGLHAGARRAADDQDLR